MQSTGNASSSDAVVNDDVSMIDTLLVLWRYKFVVLALPVFFAAAALVLAANATPVFEAVAKIEIKPLRGAVNLPMVESVKARIESLKMAERIIAAQPIEVDGRRLTAQEVARGHITAQGVRNSGVMLIRARFSDPALSARVADLVAENAEAVVSAPEQMAGVNHSVKIAEAALEQARQAVDEFYARAPTDTGKAAPSTRRLTKDDVELELLVATYRRSLADYVEQRAAASARMPTLVVVDLAVPPTEPISPRPVRDAAVAFAVGLIGAILLVLLADAVRSRLATAH
jgi:uncharacterized protein involved in exopolysaccharide biosynthesis